MKSLWQPTSSQKRIKSQPAKPKDYTHGIHTWHDNQNYVGQYINGKLEGQGVFNWPSGDKYIGQFQDGKMHGKGVFIWADGQMYEGQYIRNEK